MCAPDPYEIAQLCEAAKWPLREKIGWLKSAQAMVELMNAHRLEPARESRQK